MWESLAAFMDIAYSKAEAIVSEAVSDSLTTCNYPTSSRRELNTIHSCRIRKRIQQLRAFILGIIDTSADREMLDLGHVNLPCEIQRLARV